MMAFLESVGRGQAMGADWEAHDHSREAKTMQPSLFIFTYLKPGHCPKEFPYVTIVSMRLLMRFWQSWLLPQRTKEWRKQAASAFEAEHSALR